MSEDGISFRDISNISHRASEQALVRTQVYLSKGHRDFLSREASRRGLSMAELLRNWIDEKMNPAADSWDDNPLLDETPVDPVFEGHADGSVRSDAHIYGSVPV